MVGSVVYWRCLLHITIYTITILIVNNEPFALQRFSERYSKGAAPAVSRKPPIECRRARVGRPDRRCGDRFRVLLNC